MFAEVEPLQGGGAGGRGEGQEVTSPVLPVGNHRHLIAAAGQEVSQADLDVLPGGLLEGDVLAVDDPSCWSAVPTALVSVLALLLIRLRQLAVMEELDTEHVRLVARHVAGGHVDDDLALSVVFL